MLTIDQINRKIGDLPPLPEVVSRLLEMSRDAEVPLTEMVRVIELDPAITAKVLKLCNSAYYGLPRAVKSLQQALAYIGTDTLVNYVLAGCVSAYYRQAHEGYGLAAGELWRHSVGCALATRRIAGGEEDSDAAEFFTAGLLHDVGKIVLNTYVADKFQQITESARSKNVTFAQAERDIIGFSHTDVGAEIARRWNLPESIIEAIAFNDDPSRASGHHRLVSLVHIGNGICLSLSIGAAPGEANGAFSSMVLEAARVSLDDIDAAKSEVEQAMEEAAALVGLVAA